MNTYQEIKSISTRNKLATRFVRNRAFNPNLLLIFYSLIPGLSKIYDNRSIFIVNIAIIFMMAFATGMPRLNRGSLVLLLYMVATFLYTSYLVSIGKANDISAYTSYYMYIIPMIGFFIGTKLNPHNTASAFVKVAFLHAILGILFYELFQLPGVFGVIISKLKDGVFQFRMASVSGSIVFGALMLYGLISSVYLYDNSKSKLYAATIPIFFTCIILSQQRSAWGVSIIFLTWYFIVNIRNSWPILITCLVIIFVALYYVTSISPDLLEFFITRATDSFGDSNNSNIVNERSHMWLTAIDQFMVHPLGLGAGQGGWISYTQNVNIDIVVTDGDYFRLLMESGIAGVLVFIYLLGVVFINFVKNRNTHEKYFYWLSIASAAQMVGSNITELYYANFAFWLALGINHELVKNRIKKLSPKQIQVIAG